MKKITLEICCGSVDDVWEAKAAGADRVELNSGLFLGGLTPSIGTVLAAKDAGIPIMAMIRPREGGFCYTEREFEAMLKDIHAFVNAGVDGLVFGVLHSDGSVDAERCKRLLEAAEGRETVFHRAFDVTPDWRLALDTLIDLGFTRILTSGQAPSVPFGIRTLQEMFAYADHRIQILPGGGVRPMNIAGIVETLGCSQIHASAPRRCTDSSCLANPEIHFGGALYPPEDQFTMTDSNKVRSLLAGLGR